MKFEHLLDMVGNTPSLKFGYSDGGNPVYVKLEGANPSGSLKDRTCVYMLKDAVQSKRLDSSRKVIAASSGNFGCALALYSRLLGFDAEIAVSSKLTAEKRKYLQYLGVTLHEIGSLTIEGNNFCARLAVERPDEYCFLDQLNDWQNPQAHYVSTGPEILAAFPNVGAVVGSLGSGGAMFGVARYLKEHAPSVKTVVVQAEVGSRIPGVGSFDEGDYLTPFILEGYRLGYFDDTAKVIYDTCAMAARSAAARGIFGGIQTGAVLNAALGMDLGEVDRPIVCLSGDSGWKNLDKLQV